MKNKLLFVVMALMGVCAIVYFLNNGKHTYNWDINQVGGSKQPFGCAMFDKLMEESVPEGYEVLDDFDSLANPKTSAVLYVKRTIGNYATINDESDRAAKLVDFAKKGGVVIVSTLDFYYDYDDTDVSKSYGLEINYEADFYGNPFSYETYIEECRASHHDKIKVVDKTDGKKTAFHVKPFMIYAYELSRHYDSSVHTKLMSFYENRRYGKPSTEQVLSFARNYPSGGKMVFVGAPLFFTNYGVMDDENFNVVRRLLEPVNGRHIVRIVGVNHADSSSSKNSGVFSYLLSRPPLRLALYIALALLLIFCFCNMRRKMRPIPLQQASKNATLEFAKFMGTYSYRTGENRHIVISKYNDLLQTIKRRFDIDTTNIKNQELTDFIVSRTQCDSAKVLELIRSCNNIGNGYGVNENDMHKILLLIKEIKEKL